jgi:hypothetical protein
VVRALAAALPDISACPAATALDSALVTPAAAIPAVALARLAPILRRRLEAQG